MPRRNWAIPTPGERGPWCQIEPEEGLTGTNQRFLDRFSRVEAALGGTLQGRNINELEALWKQAKEAIRREQSCGGKGN